MIPLLTVKLSPTRALPSLSVDFRMEGTQSRVIEAEATSKLESMLTRIRGLRNIRSVSSYGSASISLEFDKHTDMDVARFEASSVIKQAWASLPEGLSYPVVKLNSPDNNASKPFMTFTVSAPLDAAAIQRVAENRIRPVLSGLEGLSSVAIYGSPPMELVLGYDPEQLAVVGVDLTSIQQAIKQYYRKEFIGTTTFIRSSESSREIRLALMPFSPEDDFDPSRIAVRNEAGETVGLDKLLSVSYAEARAQRYYRIDGRNSVYVSLSAAGDANQLKISDLVKERMTALADALPAGFSLKLSYNAADYIETELNKICLRSGLTLCILALFVLAISRNIRYVSLIIITLVVNLAVAIIFYYMLGLQIQLYSLAGITISLGLILDYTIVMTDHLLNRGNRNAYLSVLAATLSITGALSAVFFLKEELQLNLTDFAAVIIVNLGVSLLTALFLVPALAEKLVLKKKVRRNRIKYFRKVLVFNQIYSNFISLLCRRRLLVCMLLIGSFGLPVFLIPDRTDQQGKAGELFNHIFGSAFYREKVKPIADKLLGGTLRLFVQDVYDSSYFTDSEETILSVRASLPNGSTIEQMNMLVKKMESFLAGYTQIRQFQTNIYGPRQAEISIYFYKNDVAEGFPYKLKSAVIGKALELGGGSWGVWGLEDMGFSNDIRETTGSYRIELFGYNYDELDKHADRLKRILLRSPRIREVFINSEFSHFREDYEEFVFVPDRRRIAEDNLSPADVVQALNRTLAKDLNAGNVIIDNEPVTLWLRPGGQRLGELWNVMHRPVNTDSNITKLKEFASLMKEQASQRIGKLNQQYRLCLQYEYNGAMKQGEQILKSEIERFNKLLPVGYTAKSAMLSGTWNNKSSSQYMLLLLTIAVIFFTTSILFNSLRLPFAILFIIPVSYIGVFLTFYLFALNFDQGGFASFLLLCGLTVNAGIYLLKEFADIRSNKPRLPLIRAYIKAWNAKVVPVLLTAASTILGFMPFLLGTKEGFWFPLAAGITGGLLFSLLGVFLVLPVFALKRG